MHRHAVSRVRPWSAVLALLALVASTFAVAVSPAGAAEPDPLPRVLLLGYERADYMIDVQDQLTRSGAFAEVAALTPSNGCTFTDPTVEELDQYDAVLLWTDCALADPARLGDRLADYVDHGGRLVVSTFATSTSYGPQGRIVSGGYLPYVFDSYRSGEPASLEAELADHPLLAGVTTFRGGASSYRGTGMTLAEGATQVARWSTGEPLVGFKDEVVVVNFFPPSSAIRADFWDASTDGTRLLVNALTSSLEYAPSLTSAASADFTAGEAGSFTVKATGHPKPAITSTGALPDGITLTDRGNGTATLAGTPAPGTGGQYSLALTAANGIGDDASQTLDVTINEAPAVSSVPSAGFTVGEAGSFAVTTTAGYPAKTTLTQTGDLPAGMSFTDNGDGTATVSGTPADGSAGSYPINVTAANAVLSSSQTLTLTVAKVSQAVAFTSTAPTAAVVGQTYEVTATGGASANPVVLAIHEDAAGVCSLDGTRVTFRHPGSCVIVADQGGDGRYAAATASQTVAVTAAATTTDLKVTGERLTATVTPKAPGAGTPTGSVTFSVDGTAVGTASLVEGVATLAHRLPAGKARAVAATYSGDADYTGSSGSTARRDPTITAKVSSARAKSRHGWYRTAVTVTFRCTTAGAQLSAPCPKPVTLSANRAGQSVTRTILAEDGGAATVTVSGINVDRGAPRVSIKGVKRGATYPGQAPKARCASADGVSGVARCRVTKRVKGESVTVRATATDRAGNTRTTTARYTVARFYVAGAPFRNGAFQVRDGHTYAVVALTTGSARPQYFNAALRGSTPTASDSFLRRAGKQGGLVRHTLPVRMDRGMSRRGDWVVGVKVGNTLHRIPVHARR